MRIVFARGRAPGARRRVHSPHPRWLAEGALRLVGYAPASFRAHQPDREPAGARSSWTATPAIPRGYFDIDLRDPATFERYRALGLSAPRRGGARRPRSRSSAATARSSSAGPRSDRIAPGVVRVAVIGDSFTEGMGVKEEDAYPRVLHRLLDTGAESGRWEVLNLRPPRLRLPGPPRPLRDRAGLRARRRHLRDGPQRRRATDESFQARQAYLNDWILDRGRMVRDGDERRLGPTDFRLFAFVRDRLESYRVGRDTTRLVPGHVRRAQPAKAGSAPRCTCARCTSDKRTRRGPVPRRLLAPARRARRPLSVRGRDGDDRAASFCPRASRTTTCCPRSTAGPPASLWVHPVDHHPNETAHRLAAESLVEPVRRLWKEVPVVEEEGPRSGFSGGASARPVGSGGPAAHPGPSPRP